MGNEYRLTSDGYCVGEFAKGGKFLVDNADLPLVSRYTWNLGKRGYPTTHINRKTITMHRLLFNFPVGFDIDHISGDKMDNRRANLRLCTHQQNMFNQKKRNTNTTGYMGVSYLKNAHAYEAYVHHHGKKHHFGLHEAPEEAALARDYGAKKLFGEYARLNFPLEQECLHG